MYCPYFRGKQFELSLLREQASFIAQNNIRPILEPVNSNFTPLKRTIQALIDNDSDFVVIINPKYGDLKDNNAPLLRMILEEGFNEYEEMYLGYIVKPDTNLNTLRRDITHHHSNNFSIIHYGFPEARRLLPLVTEAPNVKEHVFIENHSSQLYRRQFGGDGITRILIRDGFNIMKNADYPDDEHFSDLHLTYTDDNMNGFGDFLIVGDHYVETGGRPYAVAIHITYLNEDDDMHVRHFISDRTESRADTPGKFQEAVDKLVEELNDENTLLYHSNACNEYIGLCETRHFPQLGYVKKLSMQHHLELMAEFLSG